MTREDKADIVGALIWALHHTKTSDEMSHEQAHALAVVALDGVQDAEATLGAEPTRTQ
jgi:hypothetical protein